MGVFSRQLLRGPFKTKETETTLLAHVKSHVKRCTTHPRCPRELGAKGVRANCSGYRCLAPRSIARWCWKVGAAAATRLLPTLDEDEPMMSDAIVWFGSHTECLGGMLLCASLRRWQVFHEMYTSSLDRRCHDIIVIPIYRAARCRFGAPSCPHRECCCLASFQTRRSPKHRGLACKLLRILLQLRQHVRGSWPRPDSPNKCSLHPNRHALHSPSFCVRLRAPPSTRHVRYNRHFPKRPVPTVRRNHVVRWLLRRHRYGANQLPPRPPRGKHYHWYHFYRRKSVDGTDRQRVPCFIRQIPVWRRPRCLRLSRALLHRRNRACRRARPLG